jgi:hypothetical protein
MRKINAPRTAITVGALSIIVSVVLFAAFGTSAARLFGLASNQPAGAASSASSDLHLKSAPNSRFLAKMRLLRTMEPTVETDRTDYAPGATVVITGSGWQPGEVVALRIDESDNDAPWQSSVVADDLGNIYNASFVIQTHDLGVSFILTATGSISGQVQTSFTDSAASLDQFANDAPVAWVNGNLGASKSTYVEGDSIPYRLTFTGLTLASHTVTFEWDTTKSSKHAIDYLTSFDRTVGSLANPCDGVSGCSPLSFTTVAIPADPQVTGAVPPVTPAAGVFQIYGATITAVSAYSYANGTGFVGDKSARISVTFTASVANPVLAWGGHIATRVDWGLSNSAVAIPGSPYHTRLIDLDGSGGNQDRSLSADAVIFPASITIIKDVVPNGPQDFNFTATGGLTPANFILDDDADPTHINTQAFNNILITSNSGNAYSVTETPVSGWDLGSPIVCSVTSPNGGSQSGTTNGVNINLKEGENVTCTFVNTENQEVTHGRILVDKVTNPSGDLTLFTFTPSYNGGATFQLADATAANNSGLQLPGTYSVTETANSDYTSSATCTSSIGDPADDPSAIHLAGGETVTCTFTNTKKPKLTVTKTVVPSNDSGKFNLKIDGTTFATDVGNTGSTGAQFVSVGAHTASEVAGTGTVLTDYSSVIGGDCDASGNVTLAAGDNKTCTITNTRKPKLTVTKTVVPSNDSGKFNLKIDSTTFATDVGNNGSTGAQFVSIGAHTASEVAGTGTVLTDYTSVIGGDCDASGNVTLAAGDNKTCTITNTRKPKLTVTKTVVPANDSGKFNLKIDSTTFATDVGNNGSTGAQFVSVGAHTASEAAGTGTVLTDYTSVIGGDCDASGNVTLAAGDNKTCTITNTRKPKLTVTKTVVPSNDSGKFNLKIDGTTFATDVGDTGSTGAQFVSIGAHTASEAAGTGTNLTDYTSVIGGDCAANGSVTLAAGNNKTCTITNTKKGLAKVIKTFNGGALGVNSFTFQLRSGASAGAAGTILESGTANSGNSGTINFATKLVPGTTYQMCEQMQPGWLTTLGPPLYSVFNPSGDNSVVCTDFTVAAGATKTFTINNQPPPGGLSLTIGFWKNWASCAKSSGSQKPVLDQTLLAAANAGHPITLGTLVLDPNVLGASTACQYAVNLLNKTTISGSSKVSSDPIFNMVAQLVAADLNVSAGAGQSLAVMTLRSCAHTLLTNITFNGNTYNKPLTAAQTAQANCLATQLDRYNNNLSVGTCPGCP